LLSVDIFFDGVPVHGDAALAEEIWRYAYSRAQGSAVFQKLLTEVARNWRSPIGLLGGFRADAGNRTDLKLAGLMPIFTGARVLSIKHNILARGTAARLRGATKAGALSEETAESILSAHETILMRILMQQLADADAGVRLSNAVATGPLPAADKRRLRAAIGEVSSLVDIIGEARL
jgi:signal-transduction protein with cAMP-binding, CBS, and nucleotidyltransferase domain